MARMSARQYAAHRKAKGLSGTSHTAVQKAISSGRIKADAEGRVDPVQADKAWAGNTDQSKISNDGKGGLATGGAQVAGEQAQSSPFMQARTAKEISNARLVKLKLDRETGAVVELGVVVSAAESVVLATRTKLAAIPAKIRRQLPHIAPADIKSIDKMLREALEEMAAGMQQVANNMQAPAAGKAPNA